MLTLLPKNLFEQFQRVANIWFLIVSIFQLLPYQLNPTDSWTTVAPLSILILISLAQDAYNDYLLSKKLKRLNESVYGVWNGQDFIAKKSQDILVGQIILLQMNDLVPADIILLSRSKSNDSIFFDMTNLLGVSTCKKKSGLEKIEKALGIENETVELCSLSGTIKLPEPSHDYTDFSGSFKLDGHPSASEISISHMLFSGGKIKGSGPVIGFVAYCGTESRILLNSENYRKKYSRVEEHVNRWVLLILAFLVLLVIGSIIGYYVSSPEEDSSISIIITFTLLYSNLIPISLFVSIDIIRMVQSFMFRTNFVGYTFNTDDLNENLGQIEYLVTDKTSTFTNNKIKLKYCIFNESKYVHSEGKPAQTLNSERFLCEVTGDYQPFDDIKQTLIGASQNQIESHFVKCMCLCHNLTFANDEFLGQEDDIALINAANELGYKLEIPTHKKLNIRFQNAVMPFILICQTPFDQTSQRSRVLVEDILGNGGVFYSKGTPEVMIPLLNLSAQEQEDIKRNVEELLENNCRVFILAYKILAASEIVEYRTKVQRIEKSLLNSQGKIGLIFKQIEKSMKYIGMVGIVEELQENVTETFTRFEKSGIRVWLTSSDTYENTISVAKEIGVIDPYSLLEVRKLKSELALSKFLSKAVKHLIYERGDPMTIQRTVSHMDRARRQEEGEGEENYLGDNEEVPGRNEITNNEFFRAVTYAENDVDDILNRPFEPFGMEFTVIVDRKSFLLAINDEKCRKLLVCVLACAKSVCFVELMPKDKSYVVKLLKENFRFSPCVAAIGSGESDINMLQLADIGISVNKNHDSLLFNYSDIVVDEFSKLDRLILVEGHYNYSRLAKVILLFLYKNCLLTLVQLAFTFICGFSGNSIYSSSLFVGFNIFFTTLPILFIGVYDEDIQCSKILNKPQMYSIGIFNLNFNLKQLFKYFCFSLIQAIILSLLCFKMSYSIFKDGHGENFYAVGTFIYITIIITVLIEIFIETSSYSLYYYLTLAFSVVSLMIFLIIVSKTDFPDETLNGVGSMVTSSAHALFNIFFTSLACITPVLGYNIYQELFNSSYIELLKSNYDITTDETKLYWFRDCLADIYKSSNSWKSKLEQIRFQTSKYSMMFTLPHIETKYAEHLIEFKFVNGVIIIIMIIWIILGFTVIDSSIGLILGRIVLLAGACLFFFFLFQTFFQKHYRIYTCVAILIALLSKFALEIAYQTTSFLATALVPSIVFLVLCVHYSGMFCLSVLNAVLFIISVSYEYSSKNEADFAAVHSISGIVLIISITLTSAIQGYYCEKSRRTEYELVNKLKSGIDKTTAILSIMLPPFVKNRVKDGCRYIAENQGDVTIIFCDIGYFEKICKDYKPFELTSFLDTIFSKFDSLCESTGVTKIETVGKTYMACAGLSDSDTDLLPQLRKENHGRRAVEFALAILQEISEIQLKNENFLQVKIGINSGTVSAGVVGQHKPQFSLVGDTVNTASRMCSTLEHYNSIQISQSTFELIKDYHEYHFAPRQVEAKGKGTLSTYVVSEAFQTNSDFAGGVSSGSGIGRIHSSCLSFMSEKSVVSDSEPPKREQTRTSKAWKDLLFKKNFNERMISNTPSIFKINSECDEHEHTFREQNLSKDFFSVFVSIVISIATFAILLVLNVLNISIVERRSVGPVIVRSVVLLCLILMTLFYRFLYFKRYFMYIFLLVGLLMYLVLMLLLVDHTGIPDNLIGLEIVYILMLLSQVLRNPLLPIIISTSCMLVIWVTLTYFYDDFTVHFTNAVLAAGFTIIHIKSKYLQEKYERTNFNLKALADKELKETEALLVQMMPPHVLDNLENDQVITDRLKGVTLIFADIVGFTDWSSRKTPNEIVQMLSNLFTKFDNLCVEYDVYKVHTIGDCYVVMGYTGKKQRNPSQECLNVIKMAYQMIDVIQAENVKHSSKLNMRIGVHTGEVIAGVIGTSIVRYDIWGPDVLIANKMESNGTPGRIKVSVDTKEMISSRVISGIVFEESSNVEVSSLAMSKKSFFLKCDDINQLIYE